LISYLPIFLGAISLKYNNAKDAAQAIRDSDVLPFFADLHEFVDICLIWMEKDAASYEAYNCFGFEFFDPGERRLTITDASLDK
jgi:hypothetical protein